MESSFSFLPPFLLRVLTTIPINTFVNDTERVGAYGASVYYGNLLLLSTAKNRRNHYILKLVFYLMSLLSRLREHKTRIFAGATLAGVLWYSPKFLNEHREENRPRPFVQKEHILKSGFIPFPFTNLDSPRKKENSKDAGPPNPFLEDSVMDENERLSYIESYAKSTFEEISHGKWIDLDFDDTVSLMRELVLHHYECPSGEVYAGINSPKDGFVNFNDKKHGLHCWIHRNSTEWVIGTEMKLDAKERDIITMKLSLYDPSRGNGGRLPIGDFSINQLTSITGPLRGTGLFGFHDSYHAETRWQEMSRDILEKYWKSPEWSPRDCQPESGICTTRYRMAFLDDDEEGLSGEEVFIRALMAGNTDFSGTYISRLGGRLDFRGCVDEFERAYEKFGPLNFHSANLTNTIFLGCKLTSVDLRHAQTSNTCFTRCDVTDAKLDESVEYIGIDN